MKTQLLLFTLCYFLLNPLCAQDKVLVFTKTNGFRHGSIDEGVDMIRDLGLANGLWSTDQTENANDFNTSNLAEYKAVIWCNTSGNNLLNASQRQAFENFIANGGGFLGIHAATDTYRDRSWPFYNELVGGIVQTNPNHTSNNFNANMTIVSSHPSVDFLGNVGDIWNKSEEYYYWRNNGGQLFSGNIDLLMVESTGSNDYDEARPISWYKEYGGGRSFYTAMGHNASDYTSNNNFIRHIEEGIKYVIGNTLSVGDFNSSSFFEITPNPTIDNLNIAFNKENVIKEIQIFNSTGQQVKKYINELDGNSLTLGVHDFSNGLYLGVIVTDEKRHTFKFIKN